MAEWVRDEADYQFRQPGQNQDCRVHVTGVMDNAQTERPKLLLEDRWDNKGPSVSDAFARTDCIKLLSASMKIEPDEADWFTLGQDGQLQSVSIGYDRSTQQNPEYTRLLVGGEFNHAEKDEAKKYFPDVTVNVLRTSVYPAPPEQKTELAEAFRTAYSAQHREPEVEAQPKEPNASAQHTRPEPSNTSTNAPKAGHEYDLSQEHIRER